MTAALAGGSRRPYGALELKQGYQSGLLWALLIAALLHISVIGGVGLYHQWHRPQIETIEDWWVPPLPPRDVPLEPRDIKVWSEPLPGFAPPASVEIGIPNPVADIELVRETPIATRQQVLEKILSDQAGTTPGNSSSDGDGPGLAAIAQTDLIMSPSGGFITVSEMPVPLTHEPPVYPELARATGIDGRVTVTFVIGVDGRVHDLQILKAKPAGVGFEDATIDAVSVWTFKPAVQDGHYVAVRMNQLIVFRLED